MSTVDMLRRIVEEYTPASHDVPSIVTWRTNHPVHGSVGGFGVCWPDRNADRRVLLCDIDPLHAPDVRAEECGYIVDDGASVLPYCVTRWCLHEGSTSCAPWIPGGYLMLRRQHPRPLEAPYPVRRVWHLIIRPGGVS